MTILHTTNVGDGVEVRLITLQGREHTHYSVAYFDVDAEEYLDSMKTTNDPTVANKVYAEEVSKATAHLH